MKTKTGKNGETIYFIDSTFKIRTILNFIFSFLLFSIASLLFFFSKEYLFIFQSLILLVIFTAIVSFLCGCISWRYRLTLTDSFIKKTWFFTVTIPLTDIERLEYASLLINIYSHRGKKLKIPINVFQDSSQMIDILKTKTGQLL